MGASKSPSAAVAAPHDVDVELFEAPAPASPVPATAQPPGDPHPSSPGRLGERRGARVDRSSTLGEPAPAPPESNTDSGSWSFSPTPGNGPDVGTLSGGALNAAVHAGVRKTVRESIATDDARKRQLPVYADREMELGLAPGGALATLTQDLVRRSRVPTVGHALLRLDTDASGGVASVHVLDVSSGHAEWEELAGDIVTEARTKPLRVPDGARGISVWIDVASAMKTVDGGTPTHDPVAIALGAITDPIDTAIAAATCVPLVHVVKARVVGVEAF